MLDKFGLHKITNPNGKFLKNIMFGFVFAILVFTSIFSGVGLLDHNSHHHDHDHVYAATTASQTCPNCNGAKKFRCTNGCNTSGYITGSYTCPTCNGSGTKYVQKTITCPACNGSGSIDDPSGSGGKVNCSCTGGKITISTPESCAETIPYSFDCPNCVGGYNNCTVCNATGETSLTINSLTKTQSIAIGSSLALSCSATASTGGTITYTWFCKGPADSSFSQIGTGSSYTYSGFSTTATTDQTYTFYCKLTATNCPELTSDNIEITVLVNAITITANANGGSITSTTGWTGTGETATIMISKNEAIGTLPTLASRTFATFLGWGLSENTTSYISTSTTFTSSTTIYAQWGLVDVYFPKTWMSEVTDTTNYMTTAVTVDSLTQIDFVTSASSLSGYSKIGALSTGIEVYRNTSTTTKIAFVCQYTIYAPADSSGLLGMEKITTINFNNFDTSKVTNMNTMFYHVDNSKIATLDLSGWDVSNVESMNSMFYGCGSLTTLNLTGWNTSNVKDMGAMFQNCGLTSLDLSHFKTNNVTNMASMFSNSALKTVDLTGWNTTKVTNMNNMFYNCSALTRLDLSSFNLSGLTSTATYMLYLGSSANLAKITLPSTMNSSYNVSGLFGKDLYRLDTGAQVVTAGSEITFTTTHAGLTLGASSQLPSTWKTEIASADYMTINGTETLLTPAELTKIQLEYTAPSGYSKIGELSTGVEVWQNPNVTTEIAFVYAGQLMQEQVDFSSLTALQSITFNNFDTSNVTAMTTTFANCTSLKSLDLSGWNTDKVTQFNTGYTKFVGGGGSIDDGTFYLLSSTVATGMFYNCTSLNYLNLSSFNLSNLSGSTIVGGDNDAMTYHAVLQYMFCYYYTYQETQYTTTNNSVWTKFPFRQIVLPSAMYGNSLCNPKFYSLSDLYYINGSTRTKVVTAGTQYQMTSTYAGKTLQCLLELPNNWQTQVASETYMTTTLTPANLTKIQFLSSVPTGYSQIGELSTGLKVYQNSSNANQIAFVDAETIYAPSNCSNLFSGLTSLTSISFSNFQVGSAVTSASYMFQNCSSLTELDLSSFNLSGLTSAAQYMFNFGSTSALKKLVMPGTMSASYSCAYSIFGYDMYRTDTKALVASKSAEVDLSSTYAGKTLEALPFFPTTWKNQIGSTTYMSTTASYSTLTDIQFKSSAPSGYSKIGTLSTGIEVYRNTSTTTKIAFVNSTIYAPSSCASLFSGCSALTSIDFTTFTFDSSVTSMYQMFYNCTKLTELRLYKYYWDVSGVTTMADMCYGCTALTVADFNYWKPTALTTTYRMFYGCTALQTVYLGGNSTQWKTPALTNTNWMFYNCSALTIVTVNNLTTSAVTTMTYMFYNCSKLTSLDVSNWNTSKVTTFEGMFQNCSALTTLDLKNFSLAGITSSSYTYYMLYFGSSSAIKKLVLPSTWGSYSVYYCLVGNTLYRTDTGASVLTAGTSTTLSSTYKGLTLATKLTLTANANGGTIQSTTGWTGTGTTATKTIYYSTAIGTLPTLYSRTGYTLKGWGYSSSSTYSSYSTSSTFTSDTTIYAVWSGNSYTITIDKNGGSGVNGSYVYTYPNVPTLPTPTKLGYTFSGWKVTQTAGNWPAVGESYANSDASTTETVSETGTNYYTFTNLSSTYGFSWNSAGYYQSGNTGVASSYSLCKIKFKYSMTNVVISCRSYGQSYYDYGIVSNLNQTLASSYSADSTYKKSFYGASSSSYVDVTFDSVSAGDYITIKYIKDASTNNYDDCLRFKFGTQTYSVTNTVKRAGNVTLQAQWTANDYTITIDKNGGTGVENSYTYTYPNVPTLPTPTKTGYTFTGWKVTETSGNWPAVGETYSNADATWTTTAMGEVVGTDYYTFEDITDDYVTSEDDRNPFVWKEEGYYQSGDGGMDTGATYSICKITFNYNLTDVVLSCVYMATGTYNYTMIYGLNTPYDAQDPYNTEAELFFSKTGSSSSEEWKTVNIGSVSAGDYMIVAYKRSVVSAEGNYLRFKFGNNIYEKEITTSVSRAGDVTLQAQWTANNYTITLDPNGGTMTQTSYTFTYPNVPTIPNPTRTGFAFNGWTRTKDGTDFVTINSDIAENLTLYASWTALYTVTISVNNSNYGTVTQSSVANVPSGTKITTSGNTVNINGTTVTANITNLTGYTTTFTGFTNGTATVTSNITVTANFNRTINSYLLRIDPNGGQRSDGVTGIVEVTKNYGATEAISARVRTGYTLTGYTIKNTASGSTTDIGGATLTFNTSTKEASFVQGSVACTIVAQWQANELTFNGSTLNNATYNSTYNSGEITGAGNGTGTYTYSIVSGAPSGVTLSVSSNKLTFSATTVTGNVGTYNIVVKATDSNSAKTKEATFVLQVVNATQTGTVSISGTVTYGETLTANISNFLSNTTKSYQWYYNSSNSTSGGTAISGATSQTYKIGLNLIGKYIYVVVTSTLTNYNTYTPSGITTSTVAKRNITIKANTASKVFDNTALIGTAELNSGTLASGDTATYSASSITNVGEISNVPNVVIKNGTTDITTSHYNITKVNGTLTITKATLSAPTNLKWSTTSRGTATWTASTALSGVTISYSVELYNSSTKVGTTQTTSGTSVNFASTIKSNGSGTYTFKVTAVSSVTANANNSAVATSDNLYAVKVTAQNGTGTTNSTIQSTTSVVLINGESGIAIATTLSTGYNFAGWTSTSTNLTIASSSSLSTTVSLSASTTSTQDITITATTTAIQYSITFNLNNGTWKTGYTPTTTYTIEQTITLPTSENITRTNYRFDGWFENSSFTGSAVTSISVGTTGDKEYFAKWTELKNGKITININFAEDLINTTCYGVVKIEFTNLNGERQLFTLALKEKTYTIENLLHSTYTISVINTKKINAIDDQIITISSSELSHEVNINVTKDPNGNKYVVTSN